jgi:hypothetical protein
MEDTRQIARQAAVLQLVADGYRERARRGASERRPLEQQAAALDGLAASLLSFRASSFADGALKPA